MRKIAMRLLPLLLLVSCDVYYEDNKRLLFTGTVLDQDGSGVGNISVTAFTYRPSVLSNGIREDLGAGFTDGNGRFQLISLSPEGTYRIDMAINGRFEPGYRSGRASLSLIGLEVLEGPDAALRLDELRLERIVNAKVSIQRTRNAVDTLYVSVLTNPVEKTIYVDKRLEPEMPEDFFFPTDTVFPGENEKELALSGVLAKDTVRLRYRFNADPDAEIFTEKLSDIIQSGTYVFEF